MKLSAGTQVYSTLFFNKVPVANSSLLNHQIVCSKIKVGIFKGQLSKSEQNMTLTAWQREQYQLNKKKEKKEQYQYLEI